MLNQSGERTLISAIIPPATSYISTMFGMLASTKNKTVVLAACFASIPFDFFVKSTGKSDILFDMASKLPWLEDQIILK